MVILQGNEKQQLELAESLVRAAIISDKNDKIRDLEQAVTNAKYALSLIEKYLLSLKS